METSSGRRFSVLILVALSAVAGAALSLVAVAIAMQVGPWANHKATSASCRCDGAAGTASNALPGRQAALAEDNGALQRAFLEALARNPACDERPAQNLDQPLPPAPPAEAEETPPMPTPEQIVAQEQEEAASLDGDLEQERVDPTWAPATEQATARAVAATGSMYVEEVTCRQSLCRVRVSHRDLTKRQDDVEKLLNTLPASGQARVYAPSDETATVMYFSREGMLSALAQTKP